MELMTSSAIDRNHWLAERRTGIGGSDVPIILGLSTRKSVLQLYFEKRGELEDPDISDVERIWWGNANEAAILRGYEWRTGHAVMKTGLHRSAEYPFILGTPDGLVEGLPKGVEAKNVDGLVFRTGDWGEDGTDEVPADYYAQCQQYIFVCDMESWDLAALVGGNTLKIYHIPRDNDLISMMVEEEAAFWERVVTGSPPPPDWDNPGTAGLMKRIYPGTTGEVINLPEEAAELAEQYQLLGKHQTETGKERDAVKARLLSLIGEASVGLLPDGTGFRRRLTQRKGYTVEPSEYVDFRFLKNPTP